VSKKVMAMMSESEKLLLWETETSTLATLDEDAVVELHTRVRRARSKYTKMYRRGAAAQVGKDAARYAASKKNRPAALKAEVFEDALARVSRRLAVLAKESAKQIRTERIAAARGEPTSKKPAARGRAASSGKSVASQPTRRAAKTPARKKREAGTLAKGARRQAKRDSR
jgi:hypothetical protein